MSQHTVAEAKNKLPELIKRAEKGEDVVITRHGQPVAEIRPIQPPPKVVTDADLDWLAERRRGRGKSKVDAGTFVSRMRDEDWAR